MLILDTASLSAGDRPDAVRESFSSTGIPWSMSFEGSESSLRQRTYGWKLSEGVGLLQQSGTGARIGRGPKQLRVAAPHRMTVAIQLESTGYYERHNEQMTIQPGELWMVDQTEAADYFWTGSGGCKVVSIDYDALALSPERVREVIPRLRRSPLYGLVLAQIERLDLDGDRLEPVHAQRMIGAALSELVRAMILTASSDDRGVEEGLHETLYARMADYIESHLAERGLNSNRIARAHNVSVRHLYNVWSRNNVVPIAEWVMQRRLESARLELASVGPRGVAISTIAQRWGFADSTHFSRRFRAAFGLTPSEWLDIRGHGSS